LHIRFFDNEKFIVCDYDANVRPLENARERFSKSGQSDKIERLFIIPLTDAGKEMIIQYLLNDWNSDNVLRQKNPLNFIEEL
jgi:hypothetical protein